MDEDLASPPKKSSFSLDSELVKLESFTDLTITKCNVNIEKALAECLAATVAAKPRLSGAEDRVT
jgi:hypothetical protein